MKITVTYTRKENGQVENFTKIVEMPLVKNGELAIALEVACDEIEAHHDEME